MDLSPDDGRRWTAGGSGGFDAINVAPNGTAAYASGSHGRIARLVWGK
jgi:hypothetical protein